jgi:hypothetical protein
MLTQFDTGTGTLFLMISPQLPVTIIHSINKCIIINDGLHKGGGYKKFNEGIKTILDKFKASGVHLTKFSTKSGFIFMNINESIPMSLLEDGNFTKIGTETHSNTGYIVTESIAEVTEKAYSSLAHYKRINK